MNTEQKFDLYSHEIEKIFILKNEDYGLSWLVFRDMAFADHLLMKIKRIVNAQNGAVLQVDEEIRDDWFAIANYSVMAIIRAENGGVNVNEAEIKNIYRSKVGKIKSLFLKKNSDYNESWKEMATETLTDLIYAKVMRIRYMIAQDKPLKISEDKSSNYKDIYMYVILILIKLEL